MEFEEKFNELLPHMPDWSVIMVKHFGRQFWQAATERAAKIAESFTVRSDKQWVADICLEIAQKIRGE